MHLVQILPPISDNEGNAIPKNAFHEVQRKLTETFGGVTAYSRAPAEGLWKESPGSTSRDDIVVYEVMVEGLDRGWWSGFRETLRTKFRQAELVVRALECEQL
jgi:hypothetical protein